MSRLSLIPILALLALTGCRKGDAPGAEPARPAGKLRLVFKYQPLWGDAGPFRELIASYERAHPDVEVVTESLPNSSDVLHQFYLTALEGQARDFDVFIVDTIWVPEFARAGWIADLSQAFPPRTIQKDFLPGPAEAVQVDGKTYAVPWYSDVGLLYYRTDLVPRAPKTYAELIQFTKDAQAKQPGLQGYLWQGRQYEGIVVNGYESIWGHGGKTLSPEGRLLIDTREARAGLATLRSLVTSGVSPTSVTSGAEEEARRVFQEGRAVFMRNWPYAWAETQREGSVVQGKVGFAPLPTVSGEPGHGALGGYQLALNVHTPAYKKQAAIDLIAHLTSPESSVALALANGRIPTRRAVYQDPRLKAGAPFIASLLPVLEAARPRPVTPYYILISDVLQSEFSAVVSGVREPAVALRRAQKLVDHITEGAE